MPITVNAACQKENPFNQSPDCRYKGQNPTRQQGNQQLCYRLARIAQVEIVDSQAPKKNPQDSCGNRGFTGINPRSLSPVEIISTFDANAHIRPCRSGAIGAKIPSSAHWDATVGAYIGTGEEHCSAISAIHVDNPLPFLFAKHPVSWKVSL